MLHTLISRHAKLLLFRKRLIIMITGTYHGRVSYTQPNAISWKENR